MKITKQARREAKALFRSCQVAGRLEAERVRQAVAQVIARKPRGYVSVLTHFRRLVQLEIARRTARVETAVTLPARLQSAVQGNLVRAYGEGLELTFAANPALIGGLRARVGSDVYDGSIQGRLAALAERF